MKYLFLILTIFFIHLPNVFAGNVVFEKDSSFSSDIKVGDEVIFNVDIESEKDSYNAIQGVLLISDNVEIKQIITGKSVISAWVENPSKSKNNHIVFSGIIAGGLSGSGNIFQVVLIPKTIEPIQIDLSEVSLFKNDGLGTKEEKKSISYRIPVRDKGASELNSKIVSSDKNPPEDFNVDLVKNTNIENNSYVLIFKAIDKGDGIKAYEVREGKNLFKDVESPYVLKNQNLNKKITVTAIDYAGNSRTTVLEVPNILCFKVQCINEKIIILALIPIFIFFFVLWKKQSKELKKISKGV